MFFGSTFASFRGEEVGLKLNGKTFILTSVLCLTAGLLAQTGTGAPRYSSTVLTRTGLGVWKRPQPPLPPRWEGPDTSPMWNIASEFLSTSDQNKSPVDGQNYTLLPQFMGCRLPGPAGPFLPDRPEADRHPSCSAEVSRLPRFQWPELRLTGAGGQGADEKEELSSAGTKFSSGALNH